MERTSVQWGIVVCAVAAALAACGGSGGRAPAATTATPTPGATATPRPSAAATPSPTATVAPTPTVTLSAARWTSFGPEGGDVLQLLVAPDRDDVLFARTGSRVWRSRDAGATWSEVAALAPTAASPGVVSLLAAGPTLLLAATDSQVFRSDDDGESWELASSPIASPSARSLQLLAAGPNGSVYAESDLRLFVSRDGGVSWFERRSPPEAAVVALAVDPTDPDHLLAGQVSAGASSRDGGQTWTRFVMPSLSVFRDSPLYLSSFVLDPHVPGRILVAAGSGGVFETRDDGATWQARNSGIRIAESFLSPGARVLAGAPDDPDVLLVGSSGEVYRSDDGAGSWSPSHDGLTSFDVAALVFRPDDPRVVYAGMLGAGPARSEDGGRSWVTASRGLHASFVTALAVDPADADVLYAGTGTRQARYGPVPPGPVGQLLRSLDGGRSWQALRAGAPSGEILGLAVDPATPGTVIATHETEGVLRSDDRGATWRALGAPWRRSLLGRIAVQPGDTGVMLVAAGALLRTTDGGRSWESATVDVELGADEKLCEFSDVAVDPHDPERFYVASFAGVAVSQDSGAHFEGSASCPVSNLPGLIPAYFVLPDPTTPGRVYASIRGTLQISNDGGRTFESVPLAPAAPFPAPFEMVGALGHDGLRLYVDTERGVFRSSDARRWEPWSEGLEGVSVTAFALVRGPAPALAAATREGGVALRALTDLDAAASR